MPKLPLISVPTSATPAARLDLIGFLRTLTFTNLNNVGTDYVVVTFDSGEQYTVPPGQQLVVIAEDTSADGSSQKIVTRGITTFGNSTNPVTVEVNYTAYQLGPNTTDKKFQTVQVM